MDPPAAKPVKRDWLLMALAACAMTTLVHHIHNAAFLEHYPNMPAWLTPAGVYGAGLGAMAMGALGYLSLRRGQRSVGVGLLALYAAYGLGSLAHYALAPVSAHTLAMNATIWLEASAAAALLLALALPVSSKMR